MKKRLFAGVALCLGASFSLLTACSAVSTLSFTPKWYENTSIVDAISGTYEELVYDVTKEDKSTGANAVYSLSDVSGTYTTVLINTSEYNGTPVYKLTSTLTLSGVYTMGSERKEFTDSKVSHCYFSSVKTYLRPLYSKVETVSTTPTAEKADNLESLLTTYRYTVETTYAADASKAEVKTTDYTESETGVVSEGSFKLKSAYPVIDNEELLFAIRATTPSSTAAYLCVPDPYRKEEQSIGFRLYGTQTEQTFTFAKKIAGGAAAEATEHTLDVNNVVFGRAETLSGKMQTAAFATSEGYRNVLLQLKKEMTYNLGTLIYTLKSATFADK